MAKVGQIQAKAIYTMLKNTIDECVKEDNWEFYKGRAIIIAKQIKDLKNYLENCPLPGPRDYKWASDLEYFEAIVRKIEYYSEHTEDLELCDTKDSKKQIVL